MKRIRNVFDELLAFWESNQEQLQLDYPGINFNILLITFSDYFEIPCDNDFLKSIYYRPQFNSFKSKLQLGTPINYLLQNRFFYNSNFYLNNHVLIPRFETELLVDEALKLANKFKNNSTFKLAEIGVGSGNVTLSLLVELSDMAAIEAMGIDISSLALEVFKQNCFLKSGKINPNYKISQCKSDRFKELPLDDKYHLIVSNPPYIPSDRVEVVHNQVKHWEPHQALFIERKEYYSWFLELFEQTYQHLYPGGYFIMEGFEDELSKLRPMLTKAKLTFVSIIKDYNDLDRILIAKKDDS